MAVARPAQLTIRNIITAFSEYLSGKAVDSPRLSADLLAMHVLAISRLDLITEPHRQVSEAHWQAIADLVERRGNGEPVAYLLGSREFYGRDFAVSPATLIPRPETEHIIEEVVRRFSGKGRFIFADLGTGTGCIATTIAAELPDAMGIAVDLSADALAVATANARTHGVADRLLFLNGDFTSPLFRHTSLDCIATNPPYVSEAEYAELSHEVRDYEPRTALVPGETGLEHAALLIRNAQDWLRPDGIFIMEMGYTQAGPNLSCFGDAQGIWHGEKIIRDLAGLDRMVFAIRSRN
ncbi:peptide chain release factor N(5)-glutamine methyltransferase [Desulfovibrio subterraneus]|uniref:Release factor glutamine methyltransferase n=1 Tax=Desulfovibrio subterraneus TaxID=2718620 RepID=A0A7J0BGD9_9BACT|nr:peptide chain release factor N(5)-glutamine methyltransferase [Desulfovibrio subterraneus]GFM32726.1 release factor glutamine methyltransferase [Desulfovibrio subterraneus]